MHNQKIFNASFSRITARSLASDRNHSKWEREHPAYIVMMRYGYDSAEILRDLHKANGLLGWCVNDFMDYDGTVTSVVSGIFKGFVHRHRGNWCIFPLEGRPVPIPTDADIGLASEHMPASAIASNVEAYVADTEHHRHSLMPTRQLTAGSRSSDSQRH